jgi:hypothetical protein
MRFLSAIPIRLHFPAAAIVCAAAFCVSAARAQIAPPPAQPHPQSASAQPSPQPASPPPAAPSTPSDAPAAPASVTLANGKLSVSAQNSDLNSILQQIARASGMAIDGLGKSTRVFGVYGPGNPRDVLADLLSGSGYNFAILGGGNGAAPARLVLTAQSAAPPTPANAASADESSDDGDAAETDDSGQDSLGPGAIPHPSPRALDDSDAQTRAQQNMQRLQQMRQEMMQQQQQNNPQ